MMTGQLQGWECGSQLPAQQPLKATGRQRGSVMAHRWRVPRLRTACLIQKQKHRPHYSHALYPHCGPALRPSSASARCLQVRLTSKTGSFLL